MPDLVIPDDGFLNVTIGGTTATIDAFRSHNAVAAARGRYGDQLTPEDASEFYAAVVEHLATQGFVSVSHAAAARFVDALYDAVRAIRGNWHAGPTPGSPASTGSTPPASPPDES